MTAQTTYTRGNRKAMLTRLGPEKWVPALGYCADITLEVQPACPTRRMALDCVNAWLKDARYTPEPLNDARRRAAAFLRGEITPEVWPQGCCGA